MTATPTVLSIWRYPVKSMAGEELETVAVTGRGLTGDRAYALVDNATRFVGSAKNAKRFGQLLKWRVRFATLPEGDAVPPPVIMTLPDGREMNSADAATAGQLSEMFGAAVSLASSAPEGLMMQIAAGTLGRKFAVTTEIPVSGGSPPGTFYNYAPVHVVTTATLQQLQSTYSAGQFAVERFRPNIVVAHEDVGFPENAWVGRELTIGSQVRLRVTIPCPRCVVPTLPRRTLPSDPEILHTIANENRLDLGDFGDLPCVGVYAEVVQDGIIQRGDSVQLFD